MILESAHLYEEQLVDLFHLQNLIPVVFFPTCGENTLDQLFDDDDSIVIDVKFVNTLIKIFSLSDHITILLDHDLSSARNGKTELHRMLRFRNCGYVGLKEKQRLNPL